MERTGDRDDLLRLETLRDGLLNFAAHIGFAHQIFGCAARGEIFQLAQFCAVTAGGVEVGILAAQLLEVPFPIGFVVWFTCKLSYTVVNRIPVWPFLDDRRFVIVFFGFTFDKLGQSWLFLF